MAGLKQTNQQKQALTQQSSHKRASVSRNQEPERNLKADLITETPFKPHINQHSAMLAGVSNDEQRSNLVLHLQRSYGNKYVQRLMKKMPLQAKLTVNAPNDIYEQEADRTAETVTKAINSPVQREPDEEEIQAKPMLQRDTDDEEEIQAKPVLQRDTDDEEEIQAKPILQRDTDDEEEIQAKPMLQRDTDDEEEIQAKPMLQRQGLEEEEPLQGKLQAGIQRSSPNSGFEVGSEVEDRINASRAGGESLSEQVRVPMEHAISADFSSVKVHRDANADALSQSVQARAFTTGKDIFFRNGEYDPGTPSGQKLIAHELTHTVQQGASQRIARWNPKGHKLVTQKAFEEDPPKSLFDAKVRAILTDRSPDMDFIEDQQEAMGTGIKESEGNIAKYKKGAKDLKAREKKDGKVPADDPLRVELDRMWADNELHRRDPNYMRMHGEGGMYTRDAKAAAPVNKEVTDQLVNKAADLYNNNASTKAIEILGDALHQAEDRGSHFDGERGKGHDARQMVKSGDRVPEHNDVIHGVPPISDAKPNPDNSDVNPGGARLAVGYAYNALIDFAGKIKSKDPVTAEKSTARKAKLKGTSPEFSSRGVLSVLESIGAPPGKYLKKNMKPGEWKAANKEKKPADVVEELKQRFAKQEEQKGVSKLRKRMDQFVKPEAQSAVIYYTQTMVAQSIRDLVRGKPDWYIRKHKEKYLKSLLAQWPPKDHAQVKKYAEAQLAKYGK